MNMEGGRGDASDPRPQRGRRGGPNGPRTACVLGPDMRAGDARQRDVLPLPCRAPADAYGQDLHHLSRTSQRRAHARHHKDVLRYEAADALNSMFAGDAAPPSSVAMVPTLAQQRVLEHIDEAVAALGPPPEDLTTEDALAELQVTGAYDADQPGTRAPLIVDRISLPKAGADPVPLPTLLGRDGQQWIKEFFRARVLPST